MDVVEEVAGHKVRLRDVGAILPEFDPVKNEIGVDEWIEKVEEYGEIYEWTDMEICHYALLKMKGVAKTVVQSIRPTPVNWNAWKEQLRLYFPQIQTQVSKTLSAQKYKKGKDQSVVEYFYEKLALCNKAGMRPGEMVEWIVDGYDNSRIRDFLGPLNRYAQVADLLPDLVSGDDNLSRPAKKAKLTCFKCSKEGHKAKDCALTKNKKDEKPATTSKIKC